jgi:hypothetical protein
MFSFFGLFSDPIDGLREQLARSWPRASVISIEKPLAALGVRFGPEFYQPSNEDIPEIVSGQVSRVSAENPAARFLLLRTECWGGDCAYWGHVLRDGMTIYEARGDDALRRLVLHLGVDIGVDEVFEPLRRDFRWEH